MKRKKLLLIITALCCILVMSACNKNQDDTSIVSKGTTAAKATEKNGKTTVIDVFSELNVTFEGENGSGEAIVEYTGKNDFVKSEVTFKTDRNGKYKNKDTAVVKLDFSEYKAEENNILFKETEHEYTVDGLWGTILYTDGYDFSECNKTMEELLFDRERPGSVHYDKDDDNFDIGNIIRTAYIDGEADPTAWEILSSEYEFVGSKLCIQDSKKPLNSYYRFYKVTLLCEKINDIYVIKPDSKYAVGDTKEWNFVLSERVVNVFVEKESYIVQFDPEAFYHSYITVIEPDTIITGIGKNEYTEDFDELFSRQLMSLEKQYAEIYDVE